jgi:dolichol-phosphate mannosyltransferase
MLAQAEQAAADVAVASRYVPGGSIAGLNGPLRRFYSRGLKWLTKVAFPHRIDGISDPLGGYFLVRRSILHAVPLRPLGYKILLEVLVRCPWQRVVEVPLYFAPRRHGSSKADFHQGVQFLRHLSTLVWECSPAFTWLQGPSGRSVPAAPPRLGRADVRADRRDAIAQRMA